MAIGYTALGSMDDSSITSYIAVQPQPKPYSVEAQFSKLLTPQFVLLCLGLALVFAFLQVVDANRKVLADARFARNGEIRKGKLKGIRNIRAKKINKLGVALCSAYKLVISDVCPGIAVVGASGYGKTESVCSPVIDDLIRQGKTIVVYDKKGDLRKRHAHYAFEHGYKVYSFPEQSINLLDFVDGPEDAQGAGEVVEGIHSNLGEKGARQDGFFGPQGKSALKTAVMQAKESPYPDLLMAFSFLDLSNYAARLDSARQRHNLGTWAGMASTGLKSVAHAKQTSAGIVGSAVLHLQDLLSSQSIPSLLTTEIPLDLDGKIIIFFVVDERRESASIPIITSMIEMLVKRNVNGMTERKTTFCLILDEFASATWPSIQQWVSGFRSYGFFAFLGYQTDSQVNMRYTNDEAISILSNLSTKFFFKPNDINTSDKISRLCGDTEVKYREDKRWVRSIRPLLPGAKIELFTKGECLIFSDGHGNRPWKIRIPLNRKDQKRRDSNAIRWKKDLGPQYEQCFREKIERDLAIQVANRMAIADTMLPLEEDYKFMAQNLSELSAVGG
jgi:type IV secretion system protein VirD4